MNTISLPIEIDPSKIDSRFRLVIVAAQRARQMMEGSKPTIPTRPEAKETTIALEEILSGKLNILYGKEAVAAQQEEKRLREEKRRRAMLAEREGEVSHEVKQELSIYLGASVHEEAAAKGTKEKE